MATAKRERQKALRAQKIEQMQKTEKRKKVGKKTLIYAIVLVLLAGSAIWLFTPSKPQVVTIPTTTTTTTASGSSMSGSSMPGMNMSAVPGFAAIAHPLPAGTWGVAPKVTVPTTAAPTVEEAANLITGSGPSIKLGDQFKVQYILADYASHKVIQSSWPSGFACLKTGGSFPCSLTTNSLIPGWVKGMVGMKVGGRRELIIPPALGYGAAGNSGIPGNDPLVFVIDLLKIN